MPAQYDVALTNHFSKTEFFHEYLRPSEAAKYLGVSESTLAKLRMRQKRKDGPRFAKQGGCVFYRRADLDAWIERNLISVEDFQ